MNYNKAKKIADEFSKINSQLKLHIVGSIARKEKIINDIDFISTLHLPNDKKVFRTTFKGVAIDIFQVQNLKIGKFIRTIDKFRLIALHKGLQKNNIRLTPTKLIDLKTDKTIPFNEKTIWDLAGVNTTKYGGGGISAQEQKARLLKRKQQLGIESFALADESERLNRIPAIYQSNQFIRRHAEILRQIDINVVNLRRITEVINSIDRNLVPVLAEPEEKDIKEEKGAGVNTTKENKTYIQSVLFLKDKWTLPEAKKWFKLHGFTMPKGKQVHSTDNLYRFRTVHPIDGHTYRIKWLSKKDNVKMVVGFP